MGSTRAGPGRVAVVSHGFYPTVGGSERYHLFAARALSAQASVEVFTSALNLPAGGGLGVNHVAVGPLDVHYLPSREILSERLVRPIRLWRALRRFRPDVVWGNHPSPTADLGALYALFARRPWVATYHADVGMDRWWKRRYQAWETWLLRRAKVVLVTSERYRERLVSRRIRSDRIVVAPPGPYIGDGTPPPVPGPWAGDRPEAPLLFVGALDAAHAYKHPEQLIDAVGQLARAGVAVSLEIVGDGSRRSELETRVRDLGVADRVRFLGHLSDEQLAERFAGARALVMPSPDATEGFGSVAVEAVQYGCPVIVSSRVAVGDLLGRAGAALRFEPDRPGALAEAIRSLLADPDRRASLAEGARQVGPSLRWEVLLPAITAPVLRLIEPRTVPPAPR